MSEVTAPIMTDATGQSIDSKLNSLLGKMDNLAAAFQPNASGIVYSNTTSGLTGDDVQEAIDEMAADVSEIKQSLSQFNRKYLWSGNQYTTGTITIDEALSDGDEIIFTFRAFSASYVSQMRILFLPNSLGYQYQFSFYGDSSQFARYRIKVKNDELNKLIIEDVVNGASNCALIRIDRVVNR